ncbi:Hypothetical predicted protein [Octopus vulgaris]|uniref:Uncharacterized protein n=1 Tax=Octopus vulgaris TaxID=6645 RepID=A0AA36FIJ5_OCTVU|nr:Hypothetical predicted protein [Octopus vulgaris]
MISILENGPRDTMRREYGVLTFSFFMSESKVFSLGEATSTRDNPRRKQERKRSLPRLGSDVVAVMPYDLRRFLEFIVKGVVYQ